MSKTHDILTANLVELIRMSGKLPWQVPYRTADGLPGPVNIVSGKEKGRYNGYNVLLLNQYRGALGYQYNYWLTLRQARKAGGSISAEELNRGAKIIKLMFFNPETKELLPYIPKDGEIRKVPVFGPGGTRTVTEVETDSANEDWIPRYRYSIVYNIAQTEGLDSLLTRAKYRDGVKTPAEGKAAVVRDKEYYAAAERLYQDAKRHVCPVDENHSGVPHYDIAADRVKMCRADYANPADFYSTAFHEQAHATGAAHRLGRAQKNRFGDDGYAYEELVAELSAYYATNETGIFDAVTPNNNAAYLSEWMGKLSANPSILFVASKQATRAVRWMQDGPRAEQTRTAATPEEVGEKLLTASAVVYNGVEYSVVWDAKAKVFAATASPANEGRDAPETHLGGFKKKEEAIVAIMQHAMENGPVVFDETVAAPSPEVVRSRADIPEVAKPEPDGLAAPAKPITTPVPCVELEYAYESGFGELGPSKFVAIANPNELSPEEVFIALAAPETHEEGLFNAAQVGLPCGFTDKDGEPGAVSLHRILDVREAERVPTVALAVDALMERFTEIRTMGGWSTERSGGVQPTVTNEASNEPYVTSRHEGKAVAEAVAEVPAAAEAGPAPVRRRVRF